MSSYSPGADEAAEVHHPSLYDVDTFAYDTDTEESQWVPCHRCHGSGLVEVRGQETDCLDCEGEGAVPI